jgi:hypothetical protein
VLAPSERLGLNVMSPVVELTLATVSVNWAVMTSC